MNQRSFEDALLPHYDDAVKYCITLAAQANHTEAEDLLQDALLKAIQKFEQLEEVDKFRPWLFQIISRTYISKCRLKFWKKIVPMGDQVRHIPEVFDGFVASEKQQILLKALSSLAVKQRTALVLYEVGGFSIEEIKQIQGDISISAVKSRLSRARKKMRRLIEELEIKGAHKEHRSILHNLDEVIHEATRKGVEALNRR